MQGSSNQPSLSRLRRGTKRKRKRRQTFSLALPLIGMGAGMLFVVWVVLSFQTLSSANTTLNQQQPQPGGSSTARSASSEITPYQSPLLIFTCSRANYLTETLDTIYQHIPTTCIMGCPIVVSQDKDIPEVTRTIETFQTKFAAKGIPFVHIRHPNNPNLRGNPYQKLAIHYGWALKTLFEGTAYDTTTTSSSSSYGLPQRVIILEEDLRIAPDFFAYFAATAPLLDQDPHLLAVSAFNDNGLTGQVADPQRLLRSDFFPGLGWMMTRKTWMNDLGSKWPDGYWDDWLREPPQRQGRQFIRPEITRTFHFGEKGGASQNQFGAAHNRNQLNTELVDWSSLDLSYLQEDTFARKYAAVVAQAILVKSQEEAVKVIQGGQDARIEYTGISDFARTARRFHLMTDEKARIFRTAYKGVVETRPLGKNFAFLTPPLEELKANFGSAWPS